MLQLAQNCATLSKQSRVPTRRECQAYVRSSSQAASAAKMQLISQTGAFSCVSNALARTSASPCRQTLALMVPDLRGGLTGRKGGRSGQVRRQGDRAGSSSHACSSCSCTCLHACAENPQYYFVCTDCHSCFRDRLLVRDAVTGERAKQVSNGRAIVYCY